MSTNSPSSPPLQLAACPRGCEVSSGRRPHDLMLWHRKPGKGVVCVGGSRVAGGLIGCCGGEAGVGQWSWLRWGLRQSGGPSAPAVPAEPAVHALHAVPGGGQQVMGPGGGPAAHNPRISAAVR